MKNIKLFEEFKKAKKIYKDHDKGKDGIHEISKKINPKYRVELSNIKGAVRSLKKVMRNVTSEMGIKGRISYLDAGMWGMAFKIKNRVIKLTANEEEVNTAKSMINKKTKYTIQYYMVTWIKKYEIWAILMDLADPISEAERVIIDTAQSCLDKEELMEEIKEYNISKTKASDIWDQLKELEEGLNKAGIPIADLHSGNIGYFEDRLVHFDMMPETGKEEVSALTRIET